MCISEQVVYPPHQGLLSVILSYYMGKILGDYNAISSYFV